MVLGAGRRWWSPAGARLRLLPTEGGPCALPLGWVRPRARRLPARHEGEVVLLVGISFRRFRASRDEWVFDREEGKN